MKQSRLKNHVTFELPGRKLAASFGETTFVLPPQPAKAFKAVRGRLISGEFQIEKLPAEIQTFLLQNELLYAPSERPKSFPSDQAVEILENAIEMWRSLPGFHKLFTGTENTNLTLKASLLLESAVFVSSAFSYFSAGAKSAKNPKVKRVLSKLAIEEKDHYRGLIRDLGLSEEAFRFHDPLPGTVGLISFLDSLAFRNPEYLLVVTSLFESDSTSENDIRRHYRQLSKQLGLNLKHHVEHHLEDIDLDHRDLWKTGLLSKKSISREELTGSLRALHTCKHMMVAWYDSILQNTLPIQLPKPVDLHKLIRPLASPESIHVAKK